MAEVLQITSPGHTRTEVRRAVEVLEGGGVLGLPDETGYLIAVSPLHRGGVSRAAASPAADGMLLVAGEEAAMDYVAAAHWPRSAARLARRCWPGPLTLEVTGGIEQTLLREFPDETRQWLLQEQPLRIACSAHAFTRDVLAELQWPLAISADIRNGEASRIDSAQSLADRFGDAVDLVLDAGAPRYSDRSTAVRCTSGGWEITREGIVGRRTVSQLASQIILFVCTGNTCRSPMAEVLFRKMLCRRLQCNEDDLLERGFVVLSAGLATTPGMPASRDAVDLMQRDGIDLTSHQSQPATPDLLCVADQVVTMTESHRESIASRYPEIAERTRTLSANGSDVSDPFGGDAEDYRRCRDEIQVHLQSLLPLVMQNAA